MQTKSLLKAITKAKLKVECDNASRRFVVRGRNGYNGRFTDQDGWVSTACYLRDGERSDISIDYFPQTYVRTIKEFISALTN